jgi:hypothetical protein
MPPEFQSTDLNTVRQATGTTPPLKAGRVPHDAMPPPGQSVSAKNDALKFGVAQGQGSTPQNGDVISELFM